MAEADIINRLMASPEYEGSVLMQEAVQVIKKLQEQVVVLSGPVGPVSLPPDNKKRKKKQLTPVPIPEVIPKVFDPLAEYPEIKALGEKQYQLTITEHTSRGDWGASTVETYKISTHKLKQALVAGSMSHEYRYVQRLVAECLSGRTQTYGSTKFSFGDTPEWWESLKPEAECNDKVLELFVEINL